MLKKSVVFLSSIIAVSCTVGPNYKKTETYSDAVIKQELQLQKKHQIPKNWYALVGDEQLKR